MKPLHFAVTAVDYILAACANGLGMLIVCNLFCESGRNRSRKSSDLQSSSEFESVSYESTIRWSSVEQLSRCVRKQLGCEDPWRIGGGRCGGSSKRIKKYGLGMSGVFRCILKILAFSKVSGFRDVYHFRLSGESSQSVRSEIIQPRQTN